MISAEELKQTKFTLSNEKIVKDFLATFNLELTRRSSNSAFFHFFGQKNFGYSKHIFEIENQDVMAFFDYLNKSKNLTLNTKKARFSGFRKFMSYIFRKYNKFFDLEQKVDMYFLLTDDSWQTWGKIGHKKQKIKEVLKKQEIEVICNFLKVKDNQKYLMYRILIETGMRKSEVLKIKIDCEDYYTNIETSLEEYLDMNVIPTEGKTGYKEYPIPKFSELKNLMKRHLKERRRVNVEYRELFLSNRRKPYFIPCATLNEFLNKNKEIMGFSRNRSLFPHLFRHTLNTLREEMNCPEDIREFLVGHAPTTSNKRYTHRDRKRKVDLATKYDPYRNIEL
ncbi:hypothetical protein LCGC14_0913430 [marine sediment metagenome]|uniref:Tyr recombinase domain-containing protein n=1 Tax=marine sediment metagenome TaxID=412755 RepID=A0A0F9NXK4_9ZZZZ